ncbi:hypothetical protein ABK040_005327 [Willaertia magna]
MWVLIDRGTAMPSCYFFTGKSYIVGRKAEECQIFIPNDKSISRKHATFTIGTIQLKQVLIQQLSDEIIKPKIELTDSSKYGTFHNDKKLNENTTIELIDNDNIKFGVYNSNYLIHYQLIMFCVSRLDANERKKLAKYCQSIDVKYATIWSPQCTHLIVQEGKDFTITEKLALALLQCIPIITMKFVEALENFKEGKINTFPNENDFIPNSETLFGWKEIGLRKCPDLKVNEARKNMFEGINFLTLQSNVFEKSKLLVEGGNGILIDGSKEEINDEFCRKYENYCILLDNDFPLEQEKNLKLNYYNFQLFNNSDILASILSVDKSFVTLKRKPSIPKSNNNELKNKTQQQSLSLITSSICKEEQSTQVENEEKKEDNMEIVSDGEDDEDSYSQIFFSTSQKKDSSSQKSNQNSQQQQLEKNDDKKVSSQKETKGNEQVDQNSQKIKKEETTSTTTKDDEKSKSPPKKLGIEIPQTLDPISSTQYCDIENVKKETSKRKREKEEKKIKKEKRDSQEEENDEPLIVVEYINLITPKEEPLSQKTHTLTNSQKTGSNSANNGGSFNAKKFRKAPVGRNAVIVISSQREGGNSQTLRGTTAISTTQASVLLDETQQPTTTTTSICKLKVDESVNNNTSIFEVESESEDSGDEDFLTLLKASTKAKKKK